MRRLETPGYKDKYGLFYELETLGNTLGTGQTKVRSLRCLAAPSGRLVKSLGAFQSGK